MIAIIIVLIIIAAAVVVPRMTSRAVPPVVVPPVDQSPPVTQPPVYVPPPVNQSPPSINTPPVNTSPVAPPVNQLPPIQEVSDTQCPTCYSDWAFGTCDATCGGGSQQLTRTCIKSDVKCISPLTKTEACNTVQCLNKYTPWSDWQGCVGMCVGNTSAALTNARLSLDDVRKYRRRSCVVGGICTDGDILVDTAPCIKSACMGAEKVIGDVANGIHSLIAINNTTDPNYPRYEVVSTVPLLNRINHRTFRVRAVPGVTVPTAAFNGVLYVNIRLIYRTGTKMMIVIDQVDVNGSLIKTLILGGFICDVVAASSPTPSQSTDVPTYTYGTPGAPLQTYLDIVLFDVTPLLPMTFGGDPLPLGNYVISGDAAGIKLSGPIGVIYFDFIGASWPMLHIFFW